MLRFPLIHPPLLAAVPVEAVTVMRPGDGSTPAVFARYRELLGEAGRCGRSGTWSSTPSAASQTSRSAWPPGDDRLYANVLLTVGYITPAAP